MLSIVENELLNTNQGKETAALKDLIFKNLSINKVFDNSFGAIRKLIWYIFKNYDTWVFLK